MVAVHAAGHDLAVDDGGQRNVRFIFRRAGGRGLAAETFHEFVEVGIRRLGGGFGNFRQRADAEFQWIGKRVGRGEPDFAVAGRGVGGDGNFDDHRVNHRRIGRAVGRVLENFCRGFLRVPSRRPPSRHWCRDRPGALAWNFSCKVFNRSRRSLNSFCCIGRLMIQHRRRDARPGDKRVGSRQQKLSADRDLKGRADFSACRINIGQMRPLLRKKLFRRGKAEWRSAWKIFMRT